MCNVRVGWFGLAGMNINTNMIWYTMPHRRIHVRVPLSGNATLLSGDNMSIKARTIDISHGGVAITDFSNEVPNTEYQIEIWSEEGRRIELSARLVRVDGGIAGFQALQVDHESMKIIDHLIFEYQTTVDFINQANDFHLLEAFDEKGNVIDVTFDSDLE